MLTLNHITHAVESLLWEAGFSWVAALLGVIALVSRGWLNALAIFGILCSIAFVAHVLGVDARLAAAGARGPLAVAAFAQHPCRIAHP